MEEEDLLQIGGVLSAQKFILENLYALILANDADPIGAARTTATEMKRQFALPARGPIQPREVETAMLNHGAHHLDRFWVGVEQRLASLLQDR